MDLSDICVLKAEISGMGFLCAIKEHKKGVNIDLEQALLPHLLSVC